MRLLLETSPYTFMVTQATQPKVDQERNQRFHKTTKEPMWVTQVLALDRNEGGGETINITVMGSKPELTVGQKVAPVELEALPWNQNGRHGVSYRAAELPLAPDEGAAA